MFLRHQSINAAVGSAVEVPAKHNRNVLRRSTESHSDCVSDVLHVEEAEVELQQSDVVGIRMEVEMSVGNA